MTARVVWDRGGEATIVALDVHGTTDGVRLVSTTPAPPGARVTGQLADAVGNAHALRFKIHGSKRREDGAFDLEGRMVDLRKELREIIRALIA